MIRVTLVCNGDCAGKKERWDGEVQEVFSICCYTQTDRGLLLLPSISCYYCVAVVEVRYLSLKVSACC